MPRTLPLKSLAFAAGAAGAIGITSAAATTALGIYAYRRWRRSGYSLAGKVVLITGGSRGLGLALAAECHRRGARLALAARDPEELDRAARQLGGAIAIPCDLTQPQAAAAAVTAVERQLGSVDVLIHDAGVIQVGPWDQMADDDFLRAMDLHCWAALRLARAVLPSMIARRSGRIVNISSIGGLIPVPHMLPYTTSKFALVGLSQGLASEVRRHGVRVTCVCPFLLRTGSQEQVELTGQHQREFAWFAAAGATSFTSQSAAAAARKIVNACQRGQAQLTLTVPGKLAAAAHGLAPSATVDAMALAARLLPRSPVEATGKRTGRDSYTPATEKLLKPLIRVQARRWNEA